MESKMPQAVSGYYSNLASEFYILSCLYRQGRDAALTRNKKAVDISVICDEGDAITVDVKASATKAEWPLGKHKQPRHPERHFVALVGYEDRIGDLTSLPRVWIVPFPQLEPLLRHYRGDMTVISRSEITKSGAQFENAWHLLKAPAV